PTSSSVFDLPECTSAPSGTRLRTMSFASAPVSTTIASMLWERSAPATWPRRSVTAVPSTAGLANQHHELAARASAEGGQRRRGLGEGEGALALDPKGAGRAALGGVRELLVCRVAPDI